MDGTNSPQQNRVCTLCSDSFAAASLRHVLCTKLSFVCPFFHYFCCSFMDLINFNRYDACDFVVYLLSVTFQRGPESQIEDECHRTKTKHTCSNYFPHHFSNLLNFIVKNPENMGKHSNYVIQPRGKALYEGKIYFNLFIRRFL